jgi:hypothetical protein
MNSENQDGTVGWKKSMAQPRTNVERLIDTIFPAWPNLWQTIQGNTVEGEKFQNGDYPLIQDPALRRGQETLEDRIEKCKSVNDFLT